MYFRNVLCIVAFATLASAAVAKQIPTPYSSDHELYDGATDDEVFEREAGADPARTAAWEQAHGGAAPSYHYGQEHDAAAWHVARDAEAEPGRGNVDGDHQSTKPAWLDFLKSKATAATEDLKRVAPTVKPYEDDVDFEGIAARNADDEEIPDFGDQEVDTFLEGLLEAREVGEEDEDYEDESDSDLERREAAEEEEEDDETEDEGPVDESEQDLSGYDEGILQRRSEGSDENIDYSLEGMEVPDFGSAFESEPHHARDLSADEDADYDAYLRSEEHRSLLESVGVTKRDVQDDMEDVEEFDEALYARQVEDDVVPDFGGLDVDTSLEGLLEAREVGDDEDYNEEDEDEEVKGADAAYDGAEVVEELVAPAVEARDAPAKGLFSFLW